MTVVTEKELDLALDATFKESPQFVTWFLDRTKFAGSEARYLWSRADNPWGKITLDWVNPETGEREVVEKESETDVLVVFETAVNIRFALHIENKLAGGKFEPFQPDMYRYRARQWLGDPKYQSYTDFQTVLVAPEAFYRVNQDEALKFDCFVPHEDLSEHISLFASNFQNDQPRSVELSDNTAS